MSQITGKRRAYKVGTFTVPATSGNYAFEKLRFGGTGDGVGWNSFQGVTALFETGVTDASCELWLAKLSVADAATRSFEEYLNDDFVYAGQTFTAAEVMETWALAGWPCFEIRVKSGGTAGSAVVAATGF